MPIPLSRIYRDALDTPLDPELDPLAASSLAQGSDVLSVALCDQNDGSKLPDDFFHFEWSKYPKPPIPPRKKRERFSQKRVGSDVPCHDPYKILTKIWDESIMDHIVKETNRYAKDLASYRLSKNELAPWSRLNLWKETCVSEMYTYFAIIFSTGIVIRNKLDEYWSNDGDLFVTPGLPCTYDFQTFSNVKFLH